MYLLYHYNGRRQSHQQPDGSNITSQTEARRCWQSPSSTTSVLFTIWAALGGCATILCNGTYANWGPRPLRMRVTQSNAIEMTRRRRSGLLGRDRGRQDGHDRSLRYGGRSEYKKAVASAAGRRAGVRIVQQCRIYRPLAFETQRNDQVQVILLEEAQYRERFRRHIDRDAF